MDDKRYLASWDNEDVIEFFASNRNTLADVYPSERHFLDKYLEPTMTVLDYGCAAGGFCSVLDTGYHVPPENYWGIDQSSKMIAIARRLYSKAHFCTDLSEVQQTGRRFGFVFSFGVLHMTLDWEEILHGLYDLSSMHLVFDLRVAKDGPTIENIATSYQTLAESESQNDKDNRVPYIVLNHNDLESRFSRIFKESDLIARFGYRHPVSETVVSPYKDVEMTVFCITKSEA